MTDVGSLRWHAQFMQAISEPLDSPELSRLVREAEMAIAQRLHELPVSANGDAEREAITEAFLSLRYLRDTGMAHSAAPENGAASAS
jgi:hypothetical protein